MTPYLNGEQECLDRECRGARYHAAAGAREAKAFRAGVPALYRDANMCDIPAGALRDSLPDDSRDLLLIGKGGRGKTHTAVAWAAATISHDGISGRWYEVPMLLSRFRASFRDGVGESEASIIAEAERPGIIILDDLGAEKASEYSAQSLYCIISRRINERKSTVITTNLTMRELHEAEPRIASRIGGWRIAHVDGPDRRGASQ